MVSAAGMLFSAGQPARPVILANGARPRIVLQHVRCAVGAGAQLAGGLKAVSRELLEIDAGRRRLPAGAEVFAAAPGKRV